MEIIEAIRSRRSVRSFKPMPVSKKVLEEVLDASRWAPSGSNTQPWEFAVLGGKVTEEVNSRLIEKVETEWVDPGVGHSHKYYRLTRRGRAAGESMLAAWREFAGAVERVIGDRP